MQAKRELEKRLLAQSARVVPELMAASLVRLRVQWLYLAVAPNLLPCLHSLLNHRYRCLLPTKGLQLYLHRHQQ